MMEAPNLTLSQSQIQQLMALVNNQTPQPTHNQSSQGTFQPTKATSNLSNNPPVHTTSHLNMASIPSCSSAVSDSSIFSTNHQHHHSLLMHHQSHEPANTPWILTLEQHTKQSILQLFSQPSLALPRHQSSCQMGYRLRSHIQEMSISQSPSFSQESCVCVNGQLCYPYSFPYFFPYFSHLIP